MKSKGGVSIRRVARYLIFYSMIYCHELSLVISLLLYYRRLSCYVVVDGLNRRGFNNRRQGRGEVVQCLDWGIHGLHILSRNKYI